MKPELKYGLLAGAGGILWSLAEFALGFHGPRIAWWEYAELASIIVLVVPLYLLLRDRSNELPPFQPLPLWEALLRSLAATLVYGLVGYIYAVAYSQWVNPGWVDHLLEWKVADWRAADVPETEIRERIRAFRWTHGPTGMLAAFAVGLPVVGAIAAIFLTVWLNLRRRRALQSLS